MSYTKQRGGIILVGDLASRPAASAGEYWYLATDEDGGTLYHSDGSAWTQAAAGVSAAGGGAPDDATYITQTANGGLSAEQALSALSTGIVKVTTTTGVLSTATPDTDYVRDIGVVTHAATGKTTPVDADELPISDSAASNVLKKVSLTNLKAFLKTYFDTLYTASGGAAPIGVSELIYRYEVTGSDKASIDTGADTAQAGSNDWTGGDLVEMFLTGRTDDASARVNFDITLNNDTSAHYDNEPLGAANTTVAAAGRTADSTISATLDTHGSGGGASYVGSASLVIPNYAGTVLFKAGHVTLATPDSTAGNESVRLVGFGFRSTAAVTRLKVAAQGSAKWKIGTQLLIYKRRSA